MHRLMCVYCVPTCISQVQCILLTYLMLLCGPHVCYQTVLIFVKVYLTSDALPNLLIHNIPAIQKEDFYNLEILIEHKLTM